MSIHKSRICRRAIARSFSSLSQPSTRSARRGASQVPSRTCSAGAAASGSGGGLCACIGSSELSKAWYVEVGRSPPSSPAARRPHAKDLSSNTLLFGVTELTNITIANNAMRFHLHAVSPILRRAYNGIVQNRHNIIVKILGIF